MEGEHVKIERNLKISLIDQIYHSFAERIRSNLIEHGKALPSVRQLAKELEVSMVTVHKAYARLEKDRLVTCIPGKGIYVRKQSSMDSPTISTPLDHFDWQKAIPDYIQRAQLMQYMQFSNSIQFATSVIYPKLLPIQLLKDEMIQLLTDDPSILISYGEPQGDYDLRIAMQQYLYELHSYRPNVDHILITSGVQQGIDLVARSFIGPGDVVFMEAPCYTGAIDVMKSRGATIIPIPVDNNGIVTEGLDKLCETYQPTLIYTNPTFQNPTGTVLPESRRRELVAIAEDYNVLILEDDAVSELYFENKRPPKPIAYWDEHGHVIYIKGLSKPMSSGCRIAALAASGVLFKKLFASKVTTDIGSPLLTQKAALAMIRSKKLKEHGEKLRIALEVRRDRITGSLRKLLGETIDFSIPDGGLNLWIGLPAGMDAEELYRKALAYNVSFLPGVACFSQSPETHRFRLSFSAVSERDLDEGIERLAYLIQSELT